MRKRILLFLSILAMSSCATVYYQVATIGSPQMKVSDDGEFRYNENDLTVDYNFWSKYGKVGFVITNNTNDDIYIDLSRSFLVVNGMTFDYYQNRTYISEVSSTYVSSSAYGGSNTFAYASGWASGSASTIGNTTFADGVSYGSGRSMTSAFARSSTSSSTSKSGIEVTEKEGVWIPAHAARYFCEFSLLEAPYRKCGLPRNPSRNENASIDFTEDNTPYAFENRIMVVVGDQERHLVNSFYIQNITNLRESEAVQEDDARDCSGNKTGETIKIYKYRAQNRFYIEYKYGGQFSTTSNDRVKSNSSWGKLGGTGRSFNDGIYGR